MSIESQSWKHLHFEEEYAAWLEDGGFEDEITETGDPELRRERSLLDGSRAKLVESLRFFSMGNLYSGSDFWGRMPAIMERSDVNEREGERDP